MSATNQFPFALLQVLFTRSVVIAVPEYTPDPNLTPMAPENEVNVRLEENNKRRAVASMRTRFNPDSLADAPYSIDMECIAIFEIIEEDMQEDEVLRGLTITGHNVLYGAIREAVAWITSRQANGSLMLGLSLLRFNPPKDEKLNPTKTGSVN